MMKREGKKLEPFRGKRRVSVKEGIDIRTLEKREHASYFGSSFVRLPSGEILLFYHTSIKHMPTTDDEVKMIRYDPDADEWGAPQTVVSGANGYNGSIAGYYPPRVILLYNEYDGDTSDRKVKYSTDNGKTWSSQADPGLTDARAAQNSIGHLVRPSDYQGSGNHDKLYYATENDTMDKILLYSTTDGETWTKEGVIADFTDIGGTVHEAHLALPTELKVDEYHRYHRRMYLGMRHHDPNDEYITFWLSYTNLNGTLTDFSTPHMVPNVQGSYYLLFPYSYGLGLLVRDKEYRTKPTLYTSRDGWGFTKQKVLFHCLNGQDTGYWDTVSFPNGMVYFAFGLENRHNIKDYGRLLLISEFPRFRTTPKTFSLVDSNGEFLRGQSIDSGSLTSQKVSLFGYEKKTIYFRSDTAGTLTIEVKTHSGEWRTFDTVSVSAGSLETYIQTAIARLLRINWNPDSYPSTIQEAEIHLM